MFEIKTKSRPVGLTATPHAIPHVLEGFSRVLLAATDIRDSRKHGIPCAQRYCQVYLTSSDRNFEHLL